MYIELYGLPGAGKSTQAALLSRKLKGTNRLQEIEHSKHPPVVWNILLSPGFALRMLWLMIRSPQRGMLRQGLGCIYDFYLSRCFWKRYAHKGTFVSDHGFVQVLTQSAIVRMFLSQNPEYIKKLVKCIPDQVRLIYVSLPKKQAQKRRKEDEHDENVYRESEIIFNVMNKLVNPLQIDATKSISEIMETIVMYLKKQ